MGYTNMNNRSLKEFKGVAIVGTITLGIVSVIGGLILKGWVLITLWEWFVIPLFGLPVIGIANAIGLIIITTLLVPLENTKRNEEESISKTMGVIAGKAFLAPIFALLIGWIVKGFI